MTELTPNRALLPGVSGHALEALRNETQLFAAVEGSQFGSATLTDGGEPSLVAAPRVSPGLLHLLGVVPRVGRLFHEGDTAAGARVALISEQLWTSRFGRSTDAIHRTLTIDDEPHAIVGVLPAEFAFPERTAAVWRPLAATAGAISGRWQTIVMLRPGTTREAASDRLATISASLQNEAVLTPDRRLVVNDLVQRRYGRRFTTPLYIMLGAIALVLLVACANVSNLLLARAISRQGEFALMGALGASRGQVVAHVLVESLGLAAIGGAGGMLVAHLLLATILNLLPPDMQMLSAAASVDWRAVAFAVGVATVTCVVVGVLPAARIGRLDLVESLKGRFPGVVDHGGERWHAALVTAQLALVLVLLTGTGLLLRSFIRLVNVDPGFRTSNLLVFEIELPEGRYQAPGSPFALFEELDRLVEAAPGVSRASFADGAPPTGSSFVVDIRPEAEGRPNADSASLELPQSTVASDYFVTMGIPIVEGRTFTPDDPADAIIVNDRLARRFWGRESPVGRRFRLDPTRQWQTVVGVAGDVKQMGLEDPMGDGMEVYFPYARGTRRRSFAFIVRTNGDDAAAVQHVKERLWTLDARLPIIEAMTMEQRLGESVARPRFFLRLALAFAAIAIVLAGVGVYATAAYWVARRRRELGVRMALGATRKGVLALVVARGARLAAWGCAIGTAASLSVASVLRSLMFETDVREPAILIGMTVLLAALVVMACYLPALRASRIDPAAVLRSE